MVLSKQGKKDKVARISKELGKYPVIAVATLQNLPARHFNAIKKKLRGKAVVEVTRSTLLTKALANKPELKELESKFSGSTALVMTNLDAFALFKTLKQSKSKTPAKPGQIAPMDLVIPAGETNLAPGPVLTELKQAGIQAKIQGPKIVITSDSVVAKKGTPISDAAAKILTKLGIEPMEVGLSVLAVWDKGTVYPASILDIDDAKYLADLQMAHQHAVNLGVFAEIFNSTTMPLIIGKASRAANAISALVESKKGASEAKPAEAPSIEAKPAEAPSIEAKPAEAPSIEAKPAEPAAQA